MAVSKPSIIKLYKNHIKNQLDVALILLNLAGMA